MSKNFNGVSNVVCLVAIMSMICLCSFGQIKISGKITDENGKPLSNAYVLLLAKKDSSLVKASVSGNNGQYDFANVLTGNYIINATFMGYKPVYLAPFIVDGSKNELLIPNVKFIQKENQLSEVTVVAKKPLFEQKIDRMVVNVASSITAAGSTALEVLERSPGIIVDYQNNAISMSGKEGVVIMINGKISHMPVAAVMQKLSGMSADNIEKIELITTPPANFDAEGNAGFINIVLKGNNNYGTNGSYTATLGYGKGLISAASVNFNHRQGKINLYGDFDFLRRDFKQYFSFYRKVYNQGNDLETYINSDRTPNILNFDGRLGLDYELSKKTIFGVLMTGSDNTFSMQADNSSNLFVNKILDSVVTIENSEKHRLSNFGTNLNVLHNFSDDSKLSVNLDYVYYQDRDPVNYLNKYFNGKNLFLYDQRMRSGKLTPIKFWTATADFSGKLNRKINIESGLKISFSRFNNNVDVEREVGNTWVTDETLTAGYALKENIGAAYTSFIISLREKTDMKVGLRYELTNSVLNSNTEKNIVNRQYGNFFPSLFVSQKIDSKNSINLSYSRRITRPTFDDMAPFVIFMDPNTFFSGNPSLQPSISDAMKADYIFKKNIFSVSYTYEANPITNFSPKIDSITNKETLAAENQHDNKTVSVSLSLPFKINSWWNMQNNFTGNWQRLKAFYSGSAYFIEQKNFNIRSIQSFSLPKNISLELSGAYHSAGIFGIFKINSFGTVDLGVQKKFVNKKTSLRFAVANVIGPPTYKPSVDVPEKNLVVRGSLQFSNTTFKITFTRGFGSDKIKANRNRSTGAEEEKGRVQGNN
jgi:hypothetical protein